MQDELQWDNPKSGVKQPKVMESPLSSPVVAPVTGPRYRYFQKPPTVVSLRAGDLLAEVPDTARAKGFAAERMIELPASEIFQGPTPRISLDRLAEIAPECFRSTGFQTFVRLPAGKLALGYQLIAEQELIPEEPPYAPPAEFLPEETIPEEPVVAAEVAEEAFEAATPSPAQVMAPAPPDEAAPTRTQRLTPLRTPQPVSFKTASASPEAPVEPPTAELPPAENASFRSPTALPKAPASIRPAKEPSSPEAAPGAEPASPQKRPFTVLPLFRRKSAETQQVSPAPQVPPPPRRRIELPPPRVIAPPVAAPVEEEPVAENIEQVLTPPPPPVAEPYPELYEEEAVPPAASSEYPIEALEQPVTEPIYEEEPVQPPSPEPAAPLAEELPPPPPVAPAHIAPEPPEPVVSQPEPEPEPVPAMASSVVMTPTEHLAKASSQLSSQDDLQALFMTEENLSVDRVVELCGGLPGINSCVLSHGAAVIASNNVPDSIDLISLSAHALEMLGAMRSSSARMGIGAIPAVTLHSEKGPITFFHREDLCLLVLHKDRGFVPGVREKLQRVVDELSKARLPRPLPSKPRTLPAE